MVQDKFFVTCSQCMISCPHRDQTNKQKTGISRLRTHKKWQNISSYWRYCSVYSVHRTSVQRTSVQRTSVQRTSVQRTSVQRTSVQRTSVQRTSVQRTSVQRTSVQCTNVQHTSVQVCSIQCTVYTTEDRVCTYLVYMVLRSSGTIVFSLSMAYSSLIIKVSFSTKYRQ
jgi:hypothetical protein